MSKSSRWKGVTSTLIRAALAVGAAALIVACSGATEDSTIDLGPGDLVGDIWVLEGFGGSMGQTVPGDIPLPTLQFQPDGTIDVRDGCNSSGGSYRIDAGILIVEPANFWTLAGCFHGDLADEIAARFSSLWGRVTDADYEGDLIELLADDTVMVLRRVEQPDWSLSGTRWISNAAPAVRGERGASSDTELVFDEAAGTLVIEGACIRTLAALEFSGEGLVADARDTADVCPDRLDLPRAKRIEEHELVVAFLAQGFEVQIAADRMWLLGADGRAMNLRRNTDSRFNHNESLGVLANDTVLFVEFSEGDVETAVEILGSGRFVARRSDMSRWAHIDGAIPDAARDDLIAAIAVTDIRALYKSLKNQSGTCLRDTAESGVVLAFPTGSRRRAFTCEADGNPDEPLFQAALVAYHELVPLVAESGS